METYTLRESQADAFDNLRNEQFTILNAPTGWGKSLTICALGAQWLQWPEYKVLVVVPQRLISKGFISECEILVNGELLTWKPTLNLCEDLPDKGKVLVDWLKAPCDPDNRICVTTTQNLTFALADTPEDQLAKLFLDTMLVGDEGHHVQASQEETNSIGRIIAALLRGADASTRVLLSTAYFFRGDRLPILSQEDEGRFKRHSVPLDEYWKELKHLKSYFYDSVCFKGTVWKDLDELLKRDANSPTLFFCPRVNGILAIGGKDKFVETLVDKIEQYVSGATLWECGTEPEGDRLIVDLVSECDRPEKIRFMMEQGERVVAVLACGMMGEGADWVSCSRVIDFQPSLSDQVRNQRFGRLLRDHPAKSAVRYYSFFPFVPTLPEPAQRKEISRLFAHFHASLLFDNAIMPVRVQTGKQSGRKYKQHEDVLGEYDWPTQQQILESCSETLLGLTAEIGPLDSDSAEIALNEVLGEKFFVSEKNRPPLIKQITLLFRRRNYGVHVDGLLNAGFDKVWSTDALKPLLAYTAGACDAMTFAELYECVRQINRSGWDEHYETLRRLPAPPPIGSPLYQFVARQLRKALPQEQIEKLETIPWWDWNRITPRPTLWNRRYDELVSLGHRPVAHKDTSLNRWMYKQQVEYLDGRLSAEQIEKLSAIPWWTWSERRANVWADRYERLLALDGPPVMSKDADSEERELARFCLTLRAMKNRGTLSGKKIALIEKTIPWWTWSPFDDLWDEKFTAALKLKEAPTRRTNTPISNWRYEQLKAYRDGKLSQERIDKLETISWWTWETRFSGKGGNRTLAASLKSLLLTKAGSSSVNSI